MLANSAFYYGMLRTLTEEDRPVWTKMRFAAAQQNSSKRAPRHQRNTVLAGPGQGHHRGVGDRQVAADGVRWGDRWGVAAEVRDRLLGVIEGRAGADATARWRCRPCARWSARNGRPAALAEMLRRYCDHMHSNEPVHSWEVPE